jgi:5-methylcytosine-specific restriction enzyme subunit McrC
MKGLRTITVLEHEVVPITERNSALDGAAMLCGADQCMTEVEAQALLRMNDLRRGFCQRVSGGVKLAQYCGIVRLQTCVLEVLPKVGMADARTVDELERSRAALLTMLHNARQVSIAKVGAVPQQSVRAPLLDVFIEAFLHCALDQARRGLLSRYMPNVDNLPVMKGRFNAHGHVRHNLGSPHLLNCQYDEFTADNAYNRAIKATLEACRNWVSRAQTQRLWFETHARFASVSPVRMSPEEVLRLPRDRTTRRYEPVLTWCEWLLTMTSPAMSAGVTHTPGLLFDMNKLFEAHVSGLEETAAGDRYIVHRQGPAEALATQGDQNAFMLKPDITVWHAAQDGTRDGIVRVIDAKWKRLDPHASHWGVDQADVYQMLAYAMRYQCERLELVYPVPDQAIQSDKSLPVFKVAMCGASQQEIEVRIKTVSLWGSPSGATR